MVTCTGHIGIHEGADGRTDVHDVMAIKPNFLNYGARRGRSSAINRPRWSLLLLICRYPSFIV